MAKLTKDELLKKIDEKETLTDDDKIELMEDITDSFVETENTEDSDYKTKYEEEKTKHEELKRKYKERFMDSGKEKKDDEIITEDKKEIDIKEI